MNTEAALRCWALMRVSFLLPSSFFLLRLFLNPRFLTGLRGVGGPVYAPPLRGVLALGFAGHTIGSGGRGTIICGIPSVACLLGAGATHWRVCDIYFESSCGFDIVDEG